MTHENNLYVAQATEREHFSFSLNEWAVSPTTLRIRRDDEIIKLEPKVMQVLVFLIEHAGEVVPRQLLEESIWPDTVVGYDAVTNTVIKLRKAFGDKSRQPRFIETIPKTGYRLIAEVIAHNPPEAIIALKSPKEELTNGTIETRTLGQVRGTGTGPPKPRKNTHSLNTSLLILIFAFLCFSTYVWWSLLPSSTLIENHPTLPDRPSIAVMPFLNASNNPQQSYFSDGITEDLITDLSTIPDLFIIARNSSFAYKGQAIDVQQVANELGVQFILQGSVRKNGEMLRINAQLTDSKTGANIWAERYDTALNDVFTIQDEVTQKIITALSVQLNQPSNVRLNQQPDPTSAASYDEFLKGWQYYWKFSRDDFASAEKHFLKALEIAPDNSRAHAGLALIYWQSWQQKWHENLGNVHAGWRKASRNLELALRKPTPLAHSTKSAMYLYNRRFEEAIQEAAKAIDMNQNHAMGYLALANALAYSGQPGRAIENARKGMRLDPNFGAPYLEIIGRSQFDMGLYQEAVKSLQRALKFNPTDRNTLIALIASFGQMGKAAEATTTLNILQQEHQQQKLRPFTLDWLTNRWPYRQKNSRDHLLEGLEKVGVSRW